MSDQKYRVVTRSDFDGLVCAALLKELDMVEDVKFVHPKDMQDGKIEITDRDITCNLPYVPGAYMVFDHHASETKRVQGSDEHYVNDPNAPSAARVVYEHFGGPSRFKKITPDLMEAVDKSDSAQYSPEEVLNPTGWVLLSYIMDSRTGLGRFRDFRISNYNLMMDLIDYLLEYDLDGIMAQPDVKERLDLYREHDQKFKDQIKHCTQVHGNLAVMDTRGEEVIYAGNRFEIYGLFPQCNISVTVMWGLKRQNVVFAVGKSIFDRSSKTDVGSLCLKYGGGGHKAAGTCQVPTENADTVLKELIEQITSDG